MTLFAYNTPLDLIYVLFDKYIKKRNKKYIFYLATALILLKEDQIKELAEDHD